MKDSDEILQVTHQETRDWSSIIQNLKLTGLALNAVENAELISKEGRDITLRVAKGHQSLLHQQYLIGLKMH